MEARSATLLERSTGGKTEQIADLLVCGSVAPPAQARGVAPEIHTGEIRRPIDEALPIAKQIAEPAV